MHYEICANGLFLLSFKGVTHLLPKTSMFYALSQNNQPSWKIAYASYSKLFKELKNGIEILVGQVVFS